MTLKVQRAGLQLTGFLLCLSVLVGCQDREAPSDAETSADAEVPNAITNPEGFGAPYEIVMSPTPDAPDQPPHLSGDSLFVRIAYSGGCENHRFALGHRVEPGTTKLWLHHNAGGETCSTRVDDDVQLPVPQEARGRSTVLLLMPGDRAPYVLRSGSAGAARDTSTALR